MASGMASHRVVYMYVREIKTQGAKTREHFKFWTNQVAFS